MSSVLSGILDAISWESQLWTRFYIAALSGISANQAYYGPVTDMIADSVKLADQSLKAYNARWVNSTVNSPSPDVQTPGSKAE